MSSSIQDKPIKEHVRKAYGTIAQEYLEERRGASCCGPTDQGGVKGRSLGSGNPIALAGLKPGQRVLDLGSGAGLDCFAAASLVGPDGYVIGVDMAPEMIALASQNAERSGVANVEFRLGEIERLPVDDGQVNAVVSNCVINLSPDKSAVFAEAFRVLKPDGLLSISDIVTRGELPTEIKADPQAWCACVAGALEESDYLERIREVGFEDVQVVNRREVSAAAFLGCCNDGDAASQCCSDQGDFTTPKLFSITVTARKATS